MPAISKKQLEREKRRAAAMRENLRKRKIQAEARRTEDDKHGVE